MRIMQRMLVRGLLQAVAINTPRATIVGLGTYIGYLSWSECL